MAFFILLASFLYSTLSEGAPVASDLCSIVQPTDGGVPFRTNYRPTIRIIWTCAAITFSSSWACIHPNVYGYESTGLQRSWVKLRLFINALLFPDQFVGRAYCEWIGSKRVYVEMKGRLLRIREKAHVSANEPVDTRGEKLQRIRDMAMAIAEGVEQVTSAAGPIQEGAERIPRKTLAEKQKMGIRRARANGLPDRNDGPAKVEPHEERARMAGAAAEALKRAVEAAWTQLQQSMAKGLEERETRIASDCEWTMVHAHYIHMGGIAFKGPNQDIGFRDFATWSDKDIEAFFALKLSRDELQDVSKADGFTKAFVMIQCLSFVIQCICRGVYGLPLIQLEVACLAFIASKVGVYAFWWQKPLNVAHPKVIQSSDDPEEFPRGAAASNSSSDSPEKVAAPASFPWYRAIIETFVVGDIGLLVSPSRGWDDKIYVRRPYDKRYPTNYGCRSRHLSWGVQVATLGQTVSLAIFGVVHAIAWHGSFPTPVEKLLWRLASIGPAILALFLLGYIAAPRILMPKQIDWLLKPVVYLTTPAKFAARLVFLVLPLIQFRDLPPLTHTTVPWSDFLPHV